MAWISRRSWHVFCPSLHANFKNLKFLTLSGLAKSETVTRKTCILQFCKKTVMKLLLFFCEENCTPGRTYLIRLAGLDFTALVARVLSISPRKLQTSRLFGVACKEQITMAGLILEGRSLKSHNTDTQPRVSKERPRSVMLECGGPQKARLSGIH